MTSGNEMRLTRRFVGAAAAALWLCASSTHAQTAPFDIQQLMSTLRRVKSATGHFVERKQLQVLDKPVEASGTLIYLAPDQIQKITISPKWERIAVRQNVISIEQGQEGNARTFSLSDHPEIGAFVESIRATLAGDLPTLMRFYTVTMDGNANDWRLLLVPKERKLQDLVKTIRISGAGNGIRSVDTEEANGDRAIMSIVQEEIR